MRASETSSLFRPATRPASSPSKPRSFLISAGLSSRATSFTFCCSIHHKILRIRLTSVTTPCFNSSLCFMNMIISDSGYNRGVDDVISPRPSVIMPKLSWPSGRNTQSSSSSITPTIISSSILLIVSNLQKKPKARRVGNPCGVGPCTN